MNLIQIRRDAYRQEKRRLQINEIFSKKRAELIQQNGKASLTGRGQDEQFKNSSQSTISRLIYLLKEFPLSNNTYFQLGNFLVVNPQSYHNFLPYIIPFAQPISSVNLNIDMTPESNSFSVNKAWVITIILLRIDLVDTKYLQLKESDEAIALMLNDKRAEVVFYGLNNFLSFLLTEKICGAGLTNLSSMLSFRAFVEFLKRYQPKYNCIQEYKTFAILEEILSKISKQPIAAHLLLSQSSPDYFGRLFSVMLKQSDERSCILSTIASFSSNQESENMFNHQLIKFLLAICETSTLDNKVLSYSIFYLLTEKHDLRLLFRLLNKGLIQGIISGLGSDCKDLILLCLEIVKNSLLKIESTDNSKNVDRFLSDLENCGFREHLEDLFLKRQPKEIQEIIVWLSDEYYTDDVDL